MKNLRIKYIYAGLLCLGLAAGARAEAPIGQPAPDFTGKGSDGMTYHLADYRGKFVVLEWYNKGCPFIQKHYEGVHNMQNLQDKYVKKGVVWFEVASSAQGREGYMTAPEAEANRKKVGTNATATLLDPDADIARLYSAKTTPHMFVIDPKGNVIYEGAIDDHNSTDQEDIPRSKNYVAAALDEAMAGKPVSTPQTRSYGCSVKYK